MANFSKKSIDFIRRNPKDDAFINILEGSIRSSKTWTMIPKIIFGLNTYEVNGDRIIFGVSKQTIYNNVLNGLFDFIGTKNYSYNQSTGELWLFNTRWSVVGAKDEGSEKYIRGRTVGIAYGDELVLIPRSFFEQMKGRISDERGRLYGTTNPDNPNHWLHTDYILNQKLKDSGYVWSEKFTLDDNLSLTEKVRERYEAMFTGVFYQRMIKGMWVVAEGAIYKDAFDKDNLYDEDSRPITLLNEGGYTSMYVPIDYGTGNPTVFLHIIDDGQTFWVDREYYWDSRSANTNNTQKTDGQYVEDLQEFLKNYAPKAQCIVDPSAASLKAEMNLKGVWHTDAVNDVLDGIRTVSSLLKKKKIKIHTRCVKLKSELETYAWNANKAKIGEDEPLKVNDHAPDALRYFCHTMVPAWRIAA